MIFMRNWNGLEFLKNNFLKVWIILRCKQDVVNKLFAVIVLIAIAAMFCAGIVFDIEIWMKIKSIFLQSQA